MSTDADLVLDAITNGAADRNAIAEATGLEVQPISNHMTALKAKGLIERTEAGWVATGTAAAPKATAHEAAPPAAAALPQASKRNTKTSQLTPAPKAPAAKRPTAPPLPRPINGATRECEFAIAESGAILFKVIAGPKAGELGALGAADAMALFRLMSQVEFITENA